MAETPTPTKAAAPRKKSPARAKRTTAPGQHQKMLAGRTQATSIRKYLDALRAETGPKKKGRRRTPEQIREKILSIDAQVAMGGLDPLREIDLRQEKLLLVSELQSLTPAVKSADFEDDFAKVAKEYGERKGIAYEVWREFGVPVIVLKKAGINR